MSDGILYDYQSMDQAFEEMLRVNKNIESERSTLEGQATRLLDASTGVYAVRYNSEQQEVREMIEESNDFLQRTAQALQRAFDDMGITDLRLGDGR
jgi:uncharacterized protein YukE